MYNTHLNNYLGNGILSISFLLIDLKYQCNIRVMYGRRKTHPQVLPLGGGGLPPYWFFGFQVSKALITAHSYTYNATALKNISTRVPPYVWQHIIANATSHVFAYVDQCSQHMHTHAVCPTKYIYPHHLHHLEQAHNSYTYPTPCAKWFWPLMVFSRVFSFVNQPRTTYDLSPWCVKGPVQIFAEWGLSITNRKHMSI